MTIKSFKEYMKESATFDPPKIDTTITNFHKDITLFTTEVNSKLDLLTARRFITPYIALQHLSKLLAHFNIILPKYNFMNPDFDQHVFHVKKAGTITGQNIDGTIDSNPLENKDPDLYVYFAYVVGPDGFTEIYAELVEEGELDSLVRDEPEPIDVELDEETQNIQELSKKFLGKYLEKANDDKSLISQ